MARVVAGFRSGPSRKACWIHFVNRTTITVNIIWIDYYGREINYGYVEPRRIKSIQSFEGHPWICRDNVSKRRLHLNNDTYFVPTSSSMDTGRRIGSFPLIEVQVSIPIFPLVDLCADLVSRIINSKEAATTLELPITLKEQIAICYRNRHTSWSEFAKM